MKFTTRNLAAWSVANFFHLSGSVRRRTQKLLSTECITAIYFHNPSRKEFEYCIRWLKKKKFTFLSVDDLTKLMENDLAFPKGGVMLTVDDGWESNEANVAELADKYQVPVTIFIATLPIEEGVFWWSYIRKANSRKATSLSLQEIKKLPDGQRLKIINEIKKYAWLEREALTVEQLKRIADSGFVTIGSHTHTHPILVNCNTDQVSEELIVSRQKLESWLGKKVRSFAFPNGDYGTRETDMLKKLDYSLAFASQPGYITRRLEQNKFALPRFGFLEGASKAENICRLVGVWKIKSLKADHLPHNKNNNIAKHQKQSEVLADSQLSN
jgi:poly-beta-1,6-N-acetyl-D-glucosamine N-deacetylase